MSKIMLTIHLNPGSKKESFVSFDDEILKIKIMARPIEGEANEYLINLLSKKIKIPKSNISFIRGEKSKIKMLAFTGISKEELYLKIKELIK